MSLVNHNNNLAITASGNYCAITVVDPAATVPLISGGSCQLIEQIGFLIVGNATAAGTVNIQFQDPLDVTYRTPTTQPSPFPLTIAANGVYFGNLIVLCHGAQLAITLTAGGLTICELVGKVTEYGE